MGFASSSALLTETSDRSGDESRIAGRLDGDHVLVPLVTSAVPAVTDQLRVAASMARTTGATLHVVNPVATPDGASEAYGPDLTPDDERDLLEWAVRSVSSTSRAEPPFRFTHRLVNGILRTIRENDVDTLVVPSESTAGLLHHGLAERLALRAECDVITVNGQHGYERVPSILLAVAGGPHSGLAIDIARRVAADWDAWIDVLHVVDEDVSDRRRARAESYLEAATRRIDRESTATWLLEATDAAGAIVEQSAYYGLTVVGAPTKGRLRQFLAGSTNRTIRNGARSVVISARNHE